MGGKPKTSTKADMRLKGNKEKYGSADQRDKTQAQARVLKKGTMVYTNGSNK